MEMGRGVGTWMEMRVEIGERMGTRLETWTGLGMAMGVEDGDMDGEKMKMEKGCRQGQGWG